MNNPEKQVIKFQLDKEQEAINDLERQYKQALRDIEDRIRMLQSDELTQSRIYQIQYQKALKGQVEGILDKLHGDEYATIQQYLHDSYQDGFIGTMYSVHGQGIPLILPIDQNAAVKAVITDSQIKEGLYRGLGVNIQQLKQAIRQEITRGLAANMPLADIARNIANRSKAPLSRAKTIVRTEGHRIQQASSNDAREAAKANGCDVVKQWDGTLDKDTRPTHRRLDGQIRETNEPFEMDGKKAMYPGDFGKAEEDCNCRCVALTRARWALDEDELKVLKERAKFFGLQEDDSKAYGQAKAKDFADFRKRYLKANGYMQQSESVKVTDNGKHNAYTVDPKVVNTKAYHDKFSGMTGHKAADEAVYRESMRMLEHRNGSDMEDMVLLDARTGKFVTGNLTSTKPGSTGLTKAQYDAAMRHGGNMVIVHNHPNSSRLSYTDILTLYKNQKISATIAVGHNGSVYKISDINRRFELEKVWDLMYNTYVKEYGNAEFATLKATDMLYELGIFTAESW